ncbi:MAG: M20 family metallopeptidase [Bacillota bacterium]
MLKDTGERICNWLQKNLSTWQDLSLAIHRHPELGYQEYFACKLLTEALAAGGFTVQKGIGEMETAFWAECQGKETGPTLALLAEYDALPELGHACGHNIIGVAAVAAGLALARFRSEWSGRIAVIGTPAEETGGGKVILVQKGYFQAVDFAMMIHPADHFCVQVTSTAMDAIEYVFYGKPAHAAASPQEGISALEGVIQLFNNINALRPYLPDGVRINGIITEGGVAPNIVPERAVARFYIRAKQRNYLNALVEKVHNCARGAALATGCKVEWHNFELSYDEMCTNQTMARIFEQKLRYLGVEQIRSGREGMGSLDMGNVSQVVPAIHPYVAIGSLGLTAHTQEFAQAAGGPGGLNGLLLGAQAMALTALEILNKPALQKQIRSEFENRGSCS